MWLWTWKHSVALVLSVIIVTSLLINLRVKIANLDFKEVKLECMEPSGDGILTCYFKNPVETVNMTKIGEVSSKMSRNELRSWSNVHIHPHNFPEYMIANLGQFFTTIERLMIHNSKLKFLTRSCFTNIASNLIHLDLHHNEIESIPSDTFDDLQHLVYLQLSGNKLTKLTIPSFISQLHKLHTFIANSNKIIEIHENFFDSEEHFKNLMWIYLAGNKIEKLEIDFDKFERLKAVDMRSNFGNCSFLFNSNQNLEEIENVRLKKFEKLGKFEVIRSNKSDLMCG